MVILPTVSVTDYNTWGPFEPVKMHLTGITGQVNANFSTLQAAVSTIESRLDMGSSEPNLAVQLKTALERIEKLEARLKDIPEGAAGVW